MSHRRGGHATVIHQAGLNNGFAYAGVVLAGQHVIVAQDVVHTVADYQGTQSPRATGIAGFIFRVPPEVPS